jgi:hypothetical protein
VRITCQNYNFSINSIDYRYDLDNERCLGGEVSTAKLKKAGRLNFEEEVVRK